MRAVARGRFSFHRVHAVWLAVAMLLASAAWSEAAAGTPLQSLGLQRGQLAFEAVNVRTLQPLAAAPLFSAVTLAPGEVVSESVRVRNTGSVALSLRLRATPESTQADPGPLWSAEHGLHAQIRDANGAIVYSGPLRDLDADVHASLRSLEETVVYVAVWLPSQESAERMAMASSASASFTLYAEEVQP
jgi:hypothetical protein